MSRRPRVLFHLTVPATVDPGREAVSREVSLLSRHLVVGRTVHLVGSGRNMARIPRSVWGLQRLLELRRLEPANDLHQVFNPDLFPFPYLRFLKKPIVYCVVSGIETGRLQQARGPVSRLHVVVPTATDLEALATVECAGKRLIRPAIDAAGFSTDLPSRNRPFTLLMGSAPWTLEQFSSKGIDAILEAAGRAGDLRWILLWRGVLASEIDRRIHERGLADRVQVVHEHVDVAELLKGVHAGLLLAARRAIVKAFPQSLLESLVAGRPILVSGSMPIASWVREHRCGVVVDRVSAVELLEAIAELRSSYAEMAARARHAALESFSVERYLGTWSELYRELGAAGGGRGWGDDS